MQIQKRGVRRTGALTRGTEPEGDKCDERGRPDAEAAQILAWSEERRAQVHAGRQ